MKIFLNDLEFYCTHGLFAEEELTGGAFKVDVEVEYEPKELPVTDLQDTIDYSALFTLVKTRMQKRTGLLETIATEIAAGILEQFAIAERVSITIRKINPPIVNFHGVAGVSYELKRKR